MVLQTVPRPRRRLLREQGHPGVRGETDSPAFRLLFSASPPIHTQHTHLPTSTISRYDAARWESPVQPPSIHFNKYSAIMMTRLSTPRETDNDIIIGGSFGPFRLFAPEILLVSFFFFLVFLLHFRRSSHSMSMIFSYLLAPFRVRLKRKEKTRILYFRDRSVRCSTPFSLHAPSLIYTHGWSYSFWCYLLDFITRLCCHFFGSDFFFHFLLMTKTIMPSLYRAGVLGMGSEDAMNKKKGERRDSF